MSSQIEPTETRPRKNGAKHKFSLASMPIPQFDDLPAWMQEMRAAALECITADDVREIVRGQVARAKKGEAAAIRFVFDQLLGGSHAKGSTFVQNNYGANADRPDQPTPAIVGSQARIERMRRRVEAGLPTNNENDGTGKWPNLD